MPCPPPCAAQRARSIDHPPLGTASSMYPPMYPVVAPTAPPTTTPARTLPASTAARKPGGPLGFKGSLQPPHLAKADPQGLGRLPSGNPPGTCCVHQPRAMQLFPAQREGLHRMGIFSCSSYPRTLSCSSNKCLIAGLTKHPLCTTVPSPAAHSGHARHDLGWRCRARRRGGRRPAPFDDHAGGGVSACATRGLGRVADAKR